MADHEVSVQAFAKLGVFLRGFYESDNNSSKSSAWQRPWEKEFEDIITLAGHKNGWFTKENILFAIESWGNLLTKENLDKWLSAYTLNENEPKTIAIIMAGNIPLVGFHDFLSVMLTGNKALIKLSSNGSDNTSRYFEHYFGNRPNVIRRNRNSVAILTGKESKEQLKALGEDVFRYFGLGCRSVSKIFVPEGYDFKDFFEGIFDFNPIIEQAKYANNYDYNKAVYLMSEFNILENGFLMLKEDKSYASPIATLFYEQYDSLSNLKQHLSSDKEKIQCIVAEGVFDHEISFGQTQNPSLADYADGVDTVEFLLKT